MSTSNTEHTARGQSPDGRVTRARGAVALIAMLICSALALAACGGSSSSSGGPSTSPVASGGSGSSQPASDSTKAAKFSQCMRANGVPDFPDPGTNGKFQLRVTKGGDLDPSSAAFKGALAKCKSLEPPGFGSSGQSTASQNKLLQFVACMREHGVPNMPDPSSSGAMKITSGSGVNPQSPRFQAAMQKCRSLLPNGGANASAG